MPANATRVLSCIQPTAEMHIGNYFGAIANWVELQAQHSCVYGVVDLHAMTMPYEPEQLRRNTQGMVLDLLACGIDPEKSTLFVQSLVPEHAELCWILGCLAPYGQLTRMTQFKDKRKKLGDEKAADAISCGLFTYPVLQAADILIYRASYVPVGRDQEQHLEMARTMAQKFNGRFGVAIFPEPKALFTETPKVMSLADPTKKMSKSLGSKHYVGLFEEEDSIRAKVSTAVTDSGVLPPGVDMSPGIANLLEILKACGDTEAESSMRQDYKAGRLRYTHLKDRVGDALTGLTHRLRQRRREMESKAPSGVDLLSMSSRARALAVETMEEVRELVGLPGSKEAVVQW